MKSIKVLTAGILALSLVTSANAATTFLHITGSTAFRKATMVAIEHTMGTFTGAYVPGSGITSEQNANISILSGTIAGHVTIVKCHWTGSTGGVQTVSQTNPVITDANWLADSNLPGSGVVSLASPTFDPAAIADVNMEDSHQASTGFIQSTLHETPVGVVVFEFVVNNGVGATTGVTGSGLTATSKITNIDPLLAQVVVQGGTFLSQFTGNPADTDAVFAMGRNFDSGTRLSELAETGIGVFGSVQQYQPTPGTPTGADQAITELHLWPAETILGLSFALGQSGYGSGGQLAAAMAATGTTVASGNPGWYITYLGRPDAITACSQARGTNTAHRLTFNGYADWTGGSGSTAVADDTNVVEGLYPCWEFENLAYRTSLADTATTFPKTVANAIATQIINVDANQAGTTLSSMHVSKTIEGGVITHN